MIAHPFPKTPLNKGDVQQCLTHWSQQPAATVAAVAELTGLSRSRVSQAKQWATLGNLLNPQGLTDEGKLALEKDPYLEATVTDWLFHFSCSSSGHGLQNQSQNLLDYGLWSYFVYSFLPAQPSFTQETLVQATSKHFEANYPEEQIQTLLKSYSKTDGLSSCQFLTQNGNTYTAGTSDLANAYTVGYLLASIWKRDFNDQSSVLASDLIHAPMGLGPVLGIGETQLQEQLDRLAELEVIEQRSAKPHARGTKPEHRQQGEINYLVIRCWDNPLDLLAKAYEQDPAVPNRPLIQSLEGILDDDDGDLPFLSSAQSWLNNLCPKQFQFLIKSPEVDPPLHLAG